MEGGSDVKVVGYVRVSTNRQATEGHGLDAQRDAIRRRAEESGCEVIWVEDPGVSGRDESRPGLDYALHLLKTYQAEALVVSKLDRLARSLLHFADVIKTARAEGWNLVVLDLNLDLSTPHGQLVAHILASVAEFERQMISERTRAGLRAAAEKGVRTGPKPKPIPAETLDRLAALRQEKRTLADVAHLLTVEGFPLPSGRRGTWTPTQVRRVLAGVQT